MDIATPLTISLDRGSDTPRERIYPLLQRDDGYIATCAEHPTLSSGVINDPLVAVNDLIVLIEAAAARVRHAGLDGERSADPEASNEGNFDVERPQLEDEPEYVKGWNELVRKAGAKWDYSIYDNSAATPGQFANHGIVEQWANTGIPAEIAKKFDALLLEPADAKRLHFAGRTPEETLPYVVNAESTGWWAWPDYNIVEWVITRIPVARARMYNAMCTAVEAATWEGVAALHGISDRDLMSILRAGFTAQSVVSGAEAWSEEGHSVGDAARNHISSMGLDRSTVWTVSSRS